MPQPLSPVCTIVIALAEELEVFGRLLGGTDLEKSRCFRFWDASGSEQLAAIKLLGDMGSESGALAAEHVPDDPEHLTISLGISGSISDDVVLGDVVVATQAKNWAYRGKVVDRPEGSFDLEKGGFTAPCDQELVTLLEDLRLRRSPQWLSWEETDRLLHFPEHRKAVAKLADAGQVRDRPRQVQGPIASGPFVSASTNFNKEQLLGQDRNLLCVDMESGSLVQALHSRGQRSRFMAIRGCSDFADDRKKELEQRSRGAARVLAMANAAETARLLLLSATFSEPRVRKPQSVSLAADRHGARQLTADERLDRMSKAFMSRRNREHEALPHDRANATNKILSLLTSPASQLNISGKRGTAVLPALAMRISDDNDQFPLRVEGSAGCGKSLFLSLLYWHLHGLWKNGSFNLQPMYINIQSFLRPLPSDAPSPTEVVVVLDSLDSPCLALVDGVDERATTSLVAERRIFETLESKSARVVVGVGLKSRADDALPRRSLAHTGDPSAVLRLEPIPTKSRRARRLVAEFSRIAFGGSEAVEANVQRRIDNDSIKSLDLFVLALLFRSELRASYDHNLRYFEALEKYCTDDLAKRGYDSPDEELTRVAGAVFREEILRTEGPGDIPTTWSNLLGRHRSIRDFVLGRHILALATSLEDADDPRLADFEFVFPHEINLATKEILRSHPDLEPKVLDGLETIQRGGGPRAKAHASYLAGRIANERLKPRVRRLLHDLNAESLKGQRDFNQLPKDDLLLIRTRFISLIQLGDRHAETRYLGYLLRHDRWNNLNRGFHLEYYGDIPYDPDVPLAHEDRLGPCHRTATYLLRKLEQAIEASETYPLLGIELFTALSLVQHRHARGVADPEMVARLQHVVEKLEGGDIRLSPLLSKYLRMVRRHLQEQEFPIGRFGEFLYRLKSTPRKGWVERGLADVESVADHCLGAFLLGHLFLPERFEAPGERYDKRKILEMILFHDLAEAFTGDLLPAEKGDRERRAEAAWFDYIGMWGTYEGVADQTRLVDSWKEFEAQGTLNARIARELDKLDNLVQLTSI